MISHLPLRLGRFLFCNSIVLACAARKLPRTRTIRMLESKPSPEGGKRLRAERLRLRLSTRAVQKLSQQVAKEKNNQDYYISHGWLTEVEIGKFTPSIYKLYSLSLIYKCNFAEIMAFFGIDLLDVAREQRLVSLPHTHLVRSSLEPPGQTIMLPLELRENVHLGRTNLVSRMFEAWGEIPVALLQQLDLHHRLFGYIGIEDYTLFPLIRPGSFVEIDARQNKVRTGNWQNEFDRPIYFVELRNEYACSWCELDGTQLILLPCPQSRGQIRQVRYPADADIVGRVTAVTMRIAEAAGNPAKDSASSRTE
jgi:transcriptional regulator with XRE-family HTH domain